MVRLAVYVNGGNVQEVISDHEGVEVMIVDYDNEACSMSFDRTFDTAKCDPEYLTKTVMGKESD